MKKISFIVSIIVSTLVVTFCTKAPTSSEIEIVSPSNLTANYIGDIVKLEWQDNSNNEEGFVIERVVSGENYEEISTVEQNITTYIDENVELNWTYLYRIYGFAQNHSSDYSNEVEIIVMDTIPPNKPELVPHIGDTGDIILGNLDTLNFYNTYNVDFENNGMDAVMEGDWIKTQWFPLEDSDIDYLKIFRFNEIDYNLDPLNFVQIIDTVDYDDQIYYVDSSSMLTDKINFYFIEAFDNAGNSTLSDTTGYKLIDKPILISPVDYSIYEDIYDVTFEWLPSANAIQYRLLVFNENRELIWQNTPLNIGYFSVQYNGPPVTAGSVLIWRVDSFGSNSEITIEGNYYTIESGAESIERYLFIE